MNIAAIASALVWPVFLAILIALYREKIGQFLKDIIPHIRKFSISPTSISIELAETKGFEPIWKGKEPGAMDSRQTYILNIQDSAPQLLQQIQERSIVDYAIFDLGDGSQWLSSRLYLFTTLLHRMRGLRSIVFVDIHEAITHHFIGIADPSQVRYALAIRYPYLETAFAKAYGNLPGLVITSVYGSFEQWKTIDLVTNFFKEIQQEEPSDSDKRNWVYLKRHKKWEHAEWLDTLKVKEILQEVIDTSRVSSVDLLGKSTENQVKLILSFKVPFVARVDQDQRFQSLIDRQRLADEVIRLILD